MRKPPLRHKDPHFSANANETVERIILGPQIFKGNASKNKKYTLEVAGTVDPNVSYKIQILNADGEDHDQTNCNNLSPTNRVKCILENVANFVYVNLYRANVNVAINGVVQPALTLNKSKASVTAKVVLAEQNKLELTVTGLPTSYIRFSLVEITKRVQPPANLPPIAQISVSAANYVAPAAISFSGIASYDPDGTIVNYLWDFGDGSNGEGILVTHSYENPGSYVVRVTAVDNEGARHTVSTVVNIAPNQMPIAKIKAELTEGNLPFTAHFDADESSDVDGKIISYVWNFADGDVVTTDIPKISHTFAISGNYSVILTVVDDKGGSGISTINIFANSIPIPRFTAVSSGNSYQFDASTSSDAEPEELHYQWDFGDGSSGSGKTVEHSYSGPGEYSVTLIVSDRLSNASLTLPIVIQDPDQYQEDDLSEPGSSGYLTILNEADKKFNLLNETIVFQIEGAQFSLEESNTSIEVNGELVSENLYSVSSQQINVSQFLKNGLNQIKVLSVDSTGLPIEDEFQVWAGERNVSVSATDRNGNSVQGLTLKYQLATNEQVTGTSANHLALNLPNESVVVYAQDSTGRAGVGLLNKVATNLTIQLWENEEPTESTNDNFTNGIGAWKVSADSYQIIQVPNSEERRLQARSISNIRLSKTIKPKSDTKSVMLNMNMTSSDPEDIYVMVFRNKTTGEIRVYNDTLKNFGFAPQAPVSQMGVQSKAKSVQVASESVSLSGKAAKYLSMANGSGDVEVSVYVLDGGSDGISALASDSSSEKIIDTDEVAESALCIASIAVYDWTPNRTTIVKMKKGDPDFLFDLKFIKKSLPLRHLSIGRIPVTYGEGKNIVKVVVESCGGEISSDVTVQSLGIPLGKSTLKEDSFFKPATTENIFFSAEVDLNEIHTTNSPTSIKNLEYLENFILYGFGTNRTELTLKIEDSNDEAATIHKPVLKSSIYPILVRSDFPGRRFGQRDAKGSGEDQGGDDWSTPLVRMFLANLLAFDSMIYYNDISNMNGTYSPDHGTHTKGDYVDLIFRDIYPYNEDTFEIYLNKSKPSEDNDLIRRLVEFHKNRNILSNTKRTLMTFSLPSSLTANNDFLASRISWNHIRHSCLPDGRYAKSVIINPAESIWT